MTDLVERLLDAGHNDLMAEAADELTRLRLIEQAAREYVYAKEWGDNTKPIYKKLEETLK